MKFKLKDFANKVAAIAVVVGILGYTFGAFNLTNLYTSAAASLLDDDTIIGYYETYDENDPFLHGETDGLSYSLYSTWATAYYSTGLIKVTLSTQTSYAITGCDPDLESVEIPSEINGYPVRYIEDEAFANCNMEELLIPYGIKYIGLKAFSNCINLQSVIIPNSVTSVGGCAFIGCSSLKTVRLSNQMTELPNDGKYGFFEECTSLSSITIPDSVTEIGYAAFYHCNSLTEIVVPDSVTFIDEWAFSECKKLSFVQLPKELTKLSSGLFAKDVALQEVILPNKLQEIENAAFRGCTALESIEFPESLTVISGTDTFSDCSSLSELNIPSNLTEFSFLAFDGCSGIKDVTVEAGHPTLISINGAILNKEQDTLIYCPRGKTSYTVPTSVKIIQQRIRSINIANGTETLLAGAFSNCNMQTLKLPDVKGVIEYGAFENSYIKTLEINGEWTCEKTSFKEAEIETLCVNAKLRFEDDASSAFRKVVYFKPPTPFYQDFQNNFVFFSATRRTVQMSDVALNTFGNFTGYNNGGRGLDCLQEINDGSGNIYAIYGTENKVMLIPRVKGENNVEIACPGYTFGGAAMDEEGAIFILWGYSIPEDRIEKAKSEGEENLLIIRYDLQGNETGRCGIPIGLSKAQYPFSSGNASLQVKNSILGCLFNTKWTKTQDGVNHQGAEYAAINTDTMKVVNFDTHEGSHSFGVSLVPTDYGFAAIQVGDGYRGIILNTYKVDENAAISANYDMLDPEQSAFDVISVASSFLWNIENGQNIRFHGSGKYGTIYTSIGNYKEYTEDGNEVYLHMGGMATNGITYAIAGKAERNYTTDPFYNSPLHTGIYDVFVQITDQTLADNITNVSGVDRVNAADGETADRNIIWLTQCNETEKAGHVKVVTLEDGSYCVLWERIIDNQFDSLRYVIIDSFGNLLRNESEIRGARLSFTTVQPIVQGDNLTWAVANSKNNTITWYTVNLNAPLTSSGKNGDINCDGELSVSDIVLLQKWLLANPDTVLPDWKAADLCADNRLDVFDLCLMKRQLIYG